jgi:hypothetical protein
MPRPAHGGAHARFGELCGLLEGMLRDNTRAEILQRVALTRDPAAALRESMRAHRFHGGRTIALAGLVDAMDRASGAEGFRVLHTWDPVLHRFRPDSTPVLLLGYVRPGSGAATARAHAVLLDTYLLFLLTLLAMRAWDADDPNVALDRLGELLALLQDEQGSGRRFVGSSAMLIGLGIAQYQPDERGFDALLAKIRTLDPRHQLSIALANAANFGAHLRWGRHFMYEHDVERMRADNVVDYPWVMHAVATLAAELDRTARGKAAEGSTDRVAQGLLQGLSADPGMVLATAVPAVLAGCADERATCADRLRAHRERLRGMFGDLTPAATAFVPLAFHFNFLHNVLTATLAVTIDGGSPNVPLDGLLFGQPQGATRLADSPEVLAHRLALYSAHPDRRGYKGAPLIVTDPSLGARCVEDVIGFLR